MKKLLILLIVFAVSACSGGSSSSSGMAPGQGLDSQTCMNDTIDANSACGLRLRHSLIDRRQPERGMRLKSGCRLF